MTNERQRSPRKEAAGGHGVVSSHVSITYPVWKEYGDKLDWLAGFSPHVNVGISRHPSHAAASERTDCWGCHWVYPLEGLDGICTGHPIATLDDLKDYQPPDPDQHTDWGKVRENAARAKSEGRSVSGGTDHGFIFLRLTYLRGFPDFMLDVAENPPELEQLVEVVEDYWYDVVRRWIEAGADTISFGDDLGLQHALPISPEAWRRTIKPSYQRIFSYCRSHGVRVALHSDGYIVDIIPDLIECGVSVLNPQDLVNGLDNLRRLARGKVALRLDIDRQDITVFGTPEQVDAHVFDCVKALGSPGGGLSFVWGVYPVTPLANIEAGVRAMDRYATHWVQPDTPSREGE